ncbi:nodulin-related protein 2-like [Lycium ferocissimum]|uniref:nodulin-related protein 2-like n=1 Tax=Lycium ferocissimum TaxID=112874 RepID=UPI002814AC4C|nr:nodulin-related protein 2-like [Lycium ferocissimum]
MNFLSSLSKGAGGQSTDEPKKTTGEESGSTTELFASAKVLAEAAQSHINKDGTKVDNKKVAEAAADVLDAGQKYGKLDETQGVGQYIEKAETYLHKYGSGTGTATDKPPTAAPEETKAPAAAAEAAPAPTTAPVTEGEHEEEKKSGGSDYLKMAGDFLGKK